MTYKPLVFLAVLSTTVILACKDDPSGLGGTGSLVLIVVPYEEAQPAAGAEAHSDATADAGKPNPSVTPAAAEGRSLGEAVTGAQNAGSAVEAAQRQSRRDFVRITLIGPTSLTQNETPNPDGSIDVTITDLLVGSYEIQLFGIDTDLGGEVVSEFGRTTGVQVLEDQTREATIPFGSFVPDIDPNIATTTHEFAFDVNYRSVPTATEYLVEEDTDPAFSAPTTFQLTGTTHVLSVNTTGFIYVRVRAQNNFITFSEARPSDPVAIEVVTDISPSGDDAASAPSLGVGRSATGRYTDFNIYPATDEDWFALDLTTDATLSVEVLSGSLTQPALAMASAEGTASPSDLDPVLEIFDPGLNLIASNDNDVTLEPRLIDVPISTDGTHYIRVTSSAQSSVGHYELIVTVNAEPVARVEVTPPTATIVPTGQVQLTGRTFDQFDVELFGREAIWSSSDDTIATVDGTGLVTGQSLGTATITFESEGVQGTATIDVTNVPAAKVVITPRSGLLQGIGQTVQWSAEAFDSSDNTIAGKPINWRGANPAVADADDGLVEAFGNGQTTIVAEADGAEGYALVTVTDPSAAAANYWSDGPASGVTEILFDIWGTSSNAMYAVGDAGTILFNDGSGWTSQTSGVGNRLLRVWGIDDNTAWAVGSAGVIVSTGDMGATWTLETTPTGETLQGIWGAAINDVFAVGGFGGTGVALHYDGSSWNTMSIPVTTALNSVWGSATDDVFAVGDAGVILHYDGTSWTQMTSPTAEILRTVWGTSNNDVFAVGTNGTIVHYDGFNWDDITNPSVTTAFLRSVWGTSSTEVIAAGEGGTIIQYDGVSWTAGVSGTPETLLGVFGLPNPGILAVGGNGTVRLGNRGATADITASPTHLRPDGISTSTITVQIKDATGADITSGGGDIVLSTTAGTLSPVIDNGDGSYTATLTSSLVVDTATISGTMNGQAIGDNATVDFVTAIPALTTITGSPMAIPADGASTSTITVQLNDVSGNPFPYGGDTVVLLADLGTLGLVTDNGDGTYTATLTAGVTPGFATISGTVNAVAVPSSLIVIIRGTSPPDLIGSTGEGSGLFSSLNPPNLLYSIDRTTGAATPIGRIGFERVGAMDVHPTTGTLYAVAQSASCCGFVLITIDQTTGVGTEIGELGINHRGIHEIRDLSFHSDGTLYGQLSRVFDPILFAPSSGGSSSDSLYTFDTNTGLGTLIGLAGISTREDGLTFNGTNTLFLAASSLYALSTSTGIATLLGSMTYSGGGCSSVKAIDRDPATGVFYAALECGATDGLGTFDISTKTVTFIGSSVADLDGLVVSGTSTAPTTGPASALTSTITAPAGPINADGVATAAVTVQLFDATSTALTVGGDHVALSTTLGTLSAVTDNGNGTYSATLTSTTAGTATVSGTINGVATSSTQDIIFNVTVTFASVSASIRFYSCGLTTDGVAYCWGWNDVGQLGDGSITNSNVPVPVKGSLTFQSISAGYRHTCGLTTTGAAYCWGNNPWGQLGNGSFTASSVPVTVMGGLSFQSITAGRSHTCGVTTAGAAHCWGYNVDGQLGDNSQTVRNVPVAVTGGLTFQSITAARNQTCGVTTGGIGYCWGDNGEGQLGIGSNLESHVPVAVSGGLIFQTIVTGHRQTCGVTTTGVAYCWGDNFRGQLGDGSTTSKNVPAAVEGGLTFQWIATGDELSCGVATSGAGYCWGDNSSGQLGNGSNIFSNVPVEIMGGLTFESITAGSFHTCGMTTSGAAYCWGLNDRGQLGDGSNTDSLVPIRVVDP